MAKRFIETGIWKKGWFLDLTPEEKAAWFYLLTNCDAVGVVDSAERLANFMVGTNINWKELVNKSNGHLQILDNGNMFIRKYCYIQYGESILNTKTKSKPILSHQALLRKHGIFKRLSIEYTKGIDTLKEKEKDKEKEKVKEKENVEIPVSQIDHIPEEPQICEYLKYYYQTYNKYYGITARPKDKDYKTIKEIREMIKDDLSYFKQLVHAFFTYEYWFNRTEKGKPSHYLGSMKSNIGELVAELNKTISGDIRAETTKESRRDIEKEKQEARAEYDPNAKIKLPFSK